MRFNQLHLFEAVIHAVFGIMLLFITLGIIIGTLRLFLNLGDLLMHGDITMQYVKIISDVLTLFILVELSRSIADYFSAKRLRMTFIVDAAIVFVLREVMIQLFQHTLAIDQLYALSAWLLVLSALRIGSVLVFQRERMMVQQMGKEEI